MIFVTPIINNLNGKFNHNFFWYDFNIECSTKYVRESFNDVKNLHEIAHIACKQAYQLEEFHNQFDFEHISDGIRYLGNSDEGAEFSWVEVGKHLNCLFRGIPSMNIMLGCIDKEPKVRKRIVKKAKQSNESMVTTVPSEIIQSQKDNENETNEATNERIHHLYTTIQEKGDDLLQLLINPKDNVQTIENFFDFSFLIKDKRVMESLNDQGLPIAYKTNPHALNKSEDGNRRQLILSLNMKDLLDIAEILQDEGKAHKLHRDDILYAARNAHEQADIVAARMAKVTKNKRKAERWDEDEEDK